MKKLLLAFSLLPLAVLLWAGSGPPYTPINKGRLQSNLDGNGYAITNLGTIRSTNFINASTGLPIGGTGTSGTYNYTELTNKAAPISLLETNDASSLTNLNASNLASGTVPFGRIGPTFSNLPIYYVDGVNGSDANHGRTPQAAWQTIARLSNTLNSVEIRLARGSHWREQLTLGTNNIVTAYGSGPRPILDGSDVNSSWTLVSGLTNVYATSNWVVTGGGPSTIPVIEDTAILRAATSLSECITTDGSFYSTASPVAGSTNTVFVNPTGDTDPSTNSRLYEIAKRNYALSGGNNCTVESLITRNAMSQNGSLYLGKDVAVRDVLSENGTYHNILIESGIMEDVVAWKAAHYTSQETPVVAYSTTDGLSVYFKNVNVIGSGPTQLASAGFYAHTAGVADDPGYASIIWEDCAVTYADGFGGVVANTNSFVGWFGCRAYGTALRGFTLGHGTNILENCEFLVSPDVAFSASGSAIALGGTSGRTYVSGFRSAGSPFGIIISVNSAWLSLSDSIFEGGNAVGVLAATRTNTTLISSNNIIGYGTPYKFSDSVNTTFQGNSNVYSYSSPIGFYLDGPNTNWVQWQAAVTPHDADSITNDMQWLGWPTNGDYRYTITSPAVTNQAGPGWTLRRQSTHPTLANIAPRSLPVLSRGINPLLAIYANRLTNTVDIIGGARISTNLVTTNLYAANATTSGRMTNAGMTISTTFNQLRIEDNAAAGTSSDHIIEFYDNSNARQAYIYKQGSGSGFFSFANETNFKPITFTLNGGDRFHFGVGPASPWGNVPWLIFGTSNAITPSLIVDGAGLALVSGHGVFTGTNNLRVGGNITSEGQFAGNGAGLSNAVDLIAGSNITLTTNANNRSFTIASTGAGSAVAFTNAVIGYGDEYRTNAVVVRNTGLIVTNGAARMIADGDSISMDDGVGGTDVVLTRNGAYWTIGSTTDPYDSTIYLGIGAGNIAAKGFIGDGSGLTNVTGTSSFWWTNTDAAASISNAYAVKATSFSGSGVGLTGLNPTNISSGYSSGLSIGGNAVTATTATTANAGDSATAFFSTGDLEPALMATNAAAAGKVLKATSATTAEWGTELSVAQATNYASITITNSILSGNGDVRFQITDEETAIAIGGWNAFAANTNQDYAIMSSDDALASVKVNGDGTGNVDITGNLTVSGSTTYAGTLNVGSATFTNVWFLSNSPPAFATNCFVIWNSNNVASYYVYYDNDGSPVSTNAFEDGIGDVTKAGNNAFTGSNNFAGNTTFALPILGLGSGLTNASGVGYASLTDATNAATTATNALAGQLDAVYATDAALAGATNAATITSSVNATNAGNIAFKPANNAFSGSNNFSGNTTFALPPLGSGNALTNLNQANMLITASGFDGNLATSDDTLQEVAQKVDDLVLGGATGMLTNQWTTNVVGNEIVGLVKLAALQVSGPQTNTATGTIWNSAGTHYITNNANGFGINGAATANYEFEVVGDIRASSFTTTGTASLGDTLVGGASGAMLRAAGADIGIGGAFAGSRADLGVLVLNNLGMDVNSTKYLSTNWPALRVEASTNAVGNTPARTLGIRMGTNKMEFANLIANQIQSSNYFTGGTVTITNAYIDFSSSTATNTPPANTARIFAVDVGGTTELLAEDEAGNVSQLSAHPLTAPEDFYVTTNWSAAFPKISFTVNRYTGVVEWQNDTLLTLLRQLELRGTNISTLPVALRTKLLRGVRAEETFAEYNERLGYTNGHPSRLTRLNWAAVQDQRQSDYDAARAALQAAHDAWLLIPAEERATNNITEPPTWPAKDVRRPIPALLQRFVELTP